MNIDLSGRAAIVTASSRGIGLGVARALYEAGASVCISSRDEEALSNAADHFRGEPKRIVALRADVGVPEDLERLSLRAQERFGKIDILVNNNGGPPAGESLELTDAQWQDALDRNLLSVVRLCRWIVPGMKERGWGRIINLASTTAKEPDPGMTLSNVTRAGVVAFSKTLAREVGQHGLTVNTILTGGVLTERTYELVRQSIAGTSTTFEDAVRRAGEAFPVGYLPEPLEFAQTIVFLASEHAGFVTGVALPIDGGYSRSAF